MNRKLTSVLTDTTTSSFMMLFFSSVLYEAFIPEVHAEIKIFFSHFFFSWVAQTLFCTYGMLLAILPF